MKYERGFLMSERLIYGAGVVLNALLEREGFDVGLVAEAVGLELYYFGEILAGRCPLTLELAGALEVALGARDERIKSMVVEQWLLEARDYFSDESEFLFAVQTFLKENKNSDLSLVKE